jgi:geranylgeranyl reductase family protein
MADVLIVGAGPAGAWTGSALAKECDVLIAEEHGQVGKPVQCAGLVAPRVIDMASAHDCVLNRLRGAVITFPGGQELEFSSQDVKAVVVDRGGLDTKLAATAEDAGAVIRTSTRFTGRNGGTHQLRSSAGREECHAEVLVGADGFRSTVADVLRLPPPREVVRGAEVDVAAGMDDQDRVRVLIGSDIAPGFFAWCIPCGDFTRVGLCVGGGAPPPAAFLDKVRGRAGVEGRVLARYSGEIPLGARARTYDAGALVVGDAAGHAKPISGGGVYTAMVAAGCAARTISSALRCGDVGKDAMAAYERLWKAEIGRELENGYRARKVFLSMSDAKLDKVGQILCEERVRAVLGTGDIDRPMELAPRLLRAAPGLVMMLPSALRPLLFE